MAIALAYKMSKLPFSVKGAKDKDYCIIKTPQGAVKECKWAR
jgi:hypothetical protein